MLTISGATDAQPEAIGLRGAGDGQWAGVTLRVDGDGQLRPEDCR